MIKVYQERERGEPVCIGEMIPLENVRAALVELSTRQGLPIDVEVDEVKIGKGLAAIGAPVYPCIVIYNRIHRKGYYCHVFAVEKHYNDYYVQLYLGGDSATYRTIAMYENKRDRNFLENRLLNKARLTHKDELIYHDRVLALMEPALRMAMQMPDPQEEARRRQAQEGAQRRAAQEEARRRQAQEEAQRRAAQEEARRQAQEEAQRRAAQEEARRRQAQEEAQRRAAQEEARRRQAQEEAQRRAAQEKNHRSQAREEPRQPAPTVSAGLKEAYRGPGQASREYLGGSKETCSTYRYHNGTMTWTKAPAEVVYKNFACRKCGRKFRAKSGSGCHRITCRDCGHLFEVAC